MQAGSWCRHATYGHPRHCPLPAAITCQQCALQRGGTHASESEVLLQRSMIRSQCLSPTLAQATSGFGLTVAASRRRCYCYCYCHWVCPGMLCSTLLKNCKSAPSVRVAARGWRRAPSTRLLQYPVHCQTWRRQSRAFHQGQAATFVSSTVQEELV